MSWLLDTLVWTGVLIALVLVLRRPVSQHFGPKAAYALWTLPALRLVLPPFVLPAWMAPAPQSPAPEPDPALFAAASEFPAADNVGSVLPAELVAPSLWVSIDWTQVAMAAWLAGAATFVVLRIRAYRRMRDVMLANAVDVGSIDDIRLVETPLTEAPIAFGVREKVIALPEGFLDRTDREVRDLALAHEVEHHRGRDLLVNFAIQPLFALHWFNPLCWIGWRAMRCDQEAACDARVMRERSRPERARYAEIIANFATGPRLALAAPMACPVLGDKSIIHRLRSLTMNTPSPRRRNLGRVGLVAAALVLPLTATITYAETQVPAPPAPPAPPKAPGAPLPPVAPPAPLAVQAVGEADFEEAMEDIERAEEEMEEAERVLEIEEERMEHAEGEHVRHMKIIHADGKKLTPEERARIRVEVKEAMAEARVAMDEAREAQRIALVEVRDSLDTMTVVEMNCDGDKPIAEKKLADGKRVMAICKTAIHAQALSGIREARKAIAADADMDPEVRAEVLRALDEQIAHWKRDG